MSPLLTATQLVDWADERRAQDTLPLLVRRLVLATVDPLQIDFASGDSVNRPGYDGFLQTVEGAPLVPAGQSVWEFGVNQSPTSKANEDYATRKANPGEVVPSETTFVFVTPRRWQGKAEWAAEKRAETFWLDVRALDAVDLEQWLDRCHAVAAWARRQIVGMPEGLRDLEEVWELWATRTNPPLAPNLFTAGRGEAVERVRGWLTGQPSCLRLRADSADEAVGFIAAVVQSLDPPARERVLARAVFVATADVWRAVVGTRTPTVLVTDSPDLGSEVQAVNRGHHVAVAYGNESGGVSVDVELAPLRRNEVENALRVMAVPDDRRRELAAESRGRIAALVDLLGGGTAAPRWAAPAEAPQLVPFLLAGSWCQNPGDLEAVARLARVSQDEVVHRLSRWANETDPPVRLVGGMWEWISRQRAWPHVGRHVTAADLAAFRQVAAEVLGEVDPRLDLEAEERWMASLRGCSPRYSDALRRGLAEGLAILASRPNVVRAGTDLVGLVNVVVRDLFGAEPTPRRWYSLAPVLPLLAEAAPDAFLAMCERDPVGNAPVRSALFQEEGFFGGSRHCHLLWALETLAWSSEHLSRVAVVLGGLAANDLGSRTANRPAASLQTIFLAWKSNTAASAPQKLAALDALARRHPDVAFHLCRNLIPTRHEAATPPPRPRWRPWALNRRDGVTFGEYREYVTGLFERVLCGAGTDQGRWATLLSPIRDVPDEQFEQLFARLEVLPLEQLAEQPDDRLRRAVRELLHRKRTFDEIYPEVTAAHVTRLEGVYARLAPSDRSRRDAWLFDTHPDLLSIAGNDWRVEGEARERERAAVVRDFVDASESGHLILFADGVEDPHALGYHVGQSDLADEVVTGFLAACLEAESEGRKRFARGMIWGRFRRDGWTWVGDLFGQEEPRAWPASRKAVFALALPCETTTWDWVEVWGEDVAAPYWRATASGVGDVQRDAPLAIDTLLARGRPFAAFRLAHGCRLVNRETGAVAPAILFTVLQAITAVATGENAHADQDQMPPDGIGYELGEVLGAVEQAGVCEEQELVRIEWVWFPVLDRTVRGPAALYRALVRDPAFFVHLIQLNYWPRSADGVETPRPEPDERARGLARQASRVLQEWRGFPGRCEDGGIDADALRGWVVAAREAFRQSGHDGVGDQEIGKVLARVRAGEDEAWPPACVRELLEDLCSESLEEGFYLGVMNGRGVTVRSPFDGTPAWRSRRPRRHGWRECCGCFRTVTAATHGARTSAAT